MRKERDKNIMENIRRVRIIKIDHERKNEFDVVGSESAVKVFLNGIFVNEITCTPKDLEYLAVGFLYSEGLIGTVKMVEKKFSNVYVEADKRKNLRKPRSFSIEAKKLKKSMKELLSSSELFFETGVYHLCGLSDAKNMSFVYIAQDVSRHAAVEKCIGYLIVNSKPCVPVLFLSGRVNKKIARSCIEAGIGIVASKGAVTYEAIEECKLSNVALVGFVRENRLNVYSSFDRVV